MFAALEFIKITPTPLSVFVNFSFPGELAVRRYSYSISEIDTPTNTQNVTGGQTTHDNRRNVCKKSVPDFQDCMFYHNSSTKMNSAGVKSKD